MNITVGKVIELENESSYLVGDHFMYEDKEYIAMIATTEPVHIKFAEVSKSKENQQIIFIEDVELINTLKKRIADDLLSTFAKK